MVRKYKPQPGANINVKYTERARDTAVRDVKNNILSLRQASEKYGVPVMTISRLVRGLNPGVYGGQAALSAQEEERLVKLLDICADWHHPMQYRDISVVVKGYLDRLGITEKRFNDNLPGREWFYSYLKRQPDLTVKLCENVKRVRAGITPETVNEYFDNLEEFMEGVAPENIINYDETACSDTVDKPKVVVKRGNKHVGRVMDTSKTNTSIMMAVTASGHIFPPYIVYKTKHLYDGWTEGGWKSFS